MYRISVTTLEKFRRYMTEASPYDTEESLIESLKGLFTGNDKTRIGSAYHKIIEKDFQWKGGNILAGDIVFSAEQARPAIEYALTHKNMVSEVSGSKIYDTSYFPIQVTMRLDGMEGAEVRDIKCKFRSVQWQEYIDSSQWKFYLDAYSVDVFWYDLFEIKGFTELPVNAPYYLDKDVQIIAHEPLKCERYDNMEGDIMALLESFLEYIHVRGFLPLLKDAKEPQLFFN